MLHFTGTENLGDSIVFILQQSLQQLVYICETVVPTTGLTETVCNGCSKTLNFVSPVCGEHIEHSDIS